MTYTRVSGSPVLTYSAASSASRSKSVTRSSSSVKIRIRPYGRVAAPADDPARPAAPARPDSVIPASGPGSGTGCVPGHSSAAGSRDPPGPDPRYGRSGGRGCGPWRLPRSPPGTPRPAGVPGKSPRGPPDPGRSWPYVTYCPSGAYPLAAWSSGQYSSPGLSRRSRMPSPLPSPTARLGTSPTLLTANHTSTAATMLSSGYATLAGSGKRCPAVMRTARAARAIAVSAGPRSRAEPAPRAEPESRAEPGSRPARTAARPAITTATATATTCTTSSASRDTAWKCVPVSGHALLNGCVVSGSVAKMTEATTDSATETSRMPNLAASLPTASSTRPQASHSGASRSASSWTARNVAGPNPLAKPMLCAASAMVSPRVAAVHTMNPTRGWRTHRPASMPVATAATSTPAKPTRTGRDINPYGARCPAGPGPGPRVRYFLFLRWMRVFLSSLRCFFLAMRLRRFLITDPMRPPFLGTADDGHANALAQ